VLHPADLADFAWQTARQAGRYLMKELPLGLWRKPVEHKTGRELVTEVDRASEKLIVEAIGERYPDHAVLAEEGGERPAEQGQPTYRWIVDPLDGTTNFLHGHPIFAVSIAVERLAPQGERLGAPDIVAAVVHLPYLDESFCAASGEGAFLNAPSLRLTVSPTGELGDAVVATGFAYDRQRYPNYDNFIRLARQARGIRRCGAAAVDLAYVAAGRYDAYWELGLKAHDAAAGALLVREAGGTVTDFAGGEGWLEGGNILATNGTLHDAVRALLDPLGG